MSVSFRSKINAVFFVSLLFLAVISFYSYRNTNLLIENSRWVAHTHEVRDNIERAFALCVDLEGSQRNYLITEDGKFLSSFDSSIQSLEQNLDKLQHLTSDNESQQRRIEEFRELKDQRIALLEKGIQRAKEESFEAARKFAGTSAGKKLMEEIRTLFSDMKAEEDRLLETRNNIADESTQATLWVIVAGGCLSLTVLLTSLVVVNIAESKRLRASQNLENQNRIRQGLIQLSETMSGEQDIPSLAKNIIEKLAIFTQAQIGAIYLADESGLLKRTGSYAFDESQELAKEFKPGEGLVGQAALQKTPTTIFDAPKDYFKVRSGLGEATPRFICLSPFLHEGRVKGVIELGSFSAFSDSAQDFLKLGLDSIAIAFHSTQARFRVVELLEETQSQAEELQAQQEELRAANEELNGKNQELETQQEELKQANEELEEQRSALEEQKEKLEQTNRDIERARTEVEEKAKEVELASKYKSEFLANMSHELRTPLNSILLLSKSLSENTEGNLTKDQEEVSRTVYSSGSDLLSLINDILDLSKVEAGKLDIKLAETEISELAISMQNQFRAQMAAKSLSFAVEISPTCPKKIFTDRLRLEQILKNFLSNALKFTESGKVSVLFDRPAKDAKLHGNGIALDSWISISVADTGIGIPEDKKKRIFEAFEQLDSALSRKYGGAGLGLTIATKISQLLGGEIQVESTAGQGSRFTIFLPERAAEVAQETVPKSEPKRSSYIPPARPTHSPKPHGIEDDRKILSLKADRSILIIEDDPVFAKILFGLCRERGFKCLLAGDGESGLNDAREFIPSAIILDLRLPGISGLSVLQILKENPQTKHIPVHVMSVEERAPDVLKMGAIGFLSKPVSKAGIEEAIRKIEDKLSGKAKKVLVVEDKKVERESILKLIGNGDVKTTGVAGANEALDQLKTQNFDCMVLDLKLPDMSGFELLEVMEKNEALSRPPVIVYTGRDLTTEEVERLRQFSQSIIIKGVRSEERLLDEISLFLHRVESKLPQEKQLPPEPVRHREEVFEGKKMLVVDDDMRNVFALRSIFSKKGFDISVAKTGKEALDRLQDEPNTDLVLMDIMMPEMDGYEAMRKIRSQEKFSSLPIIALTAKAMASDREKCLEAGANDYLSKPIDIDSLMSLMRVWLTR